MPFISVTKASTDLLLLHLWFLLFGEGSNKGHRRSSLDLLRRDTWDHGTIAGECRRLDRWRKEMCESKQKPWDQSWMVDQAEPVIWLHCLQTDQHPSVCAYTRMIQPLEWRGIGGDTIPQTECTYEAWQAVTGSVPEICLLWIWSPSTRSQWNCLD